MSNIDNQIPVTQIGEENDLPAVSRRSFFKRTALAGAGIMAAGGAGFAAAKSSLEGKPQSVEDAIKLAPDFKQKDQRDIVLTYATSKKLNNETYPERNEQYSKLTGEEFHFYDKIMNFEHAVPHDNNREGYSQADKSLSHAAWYPIEVARSREQAFMVPNSPLHSWDQSDVHAEKYDFGSDKRAATMIRSAARLFGAQRVGIAKFDERFVYEPMYDQFQERTLSWKTDVPFKPKSVIVFLMPMDYDNYATAPAWTAEGATGHGYVMMSTIVNQMAKFIRGMGYHAIGAGNEMANSVAYGILAGLGEAGRLGSLIAPGVGPRVRICKVFTDIDFGDAYDVPHTWGVEEFCEGCNKCAEACPADALSYDEKPSFYPTYEHADEPGYTWNNHNGVRKFHQDAKKCFNFWIKNDTACGNCVAACTFNEPDFWHHWFIMATVPYAPKFLHSWMAEAHPFFGYGGQSDVPAPGKVDKFWEYGENMRTNTAMKNNAGNIGK